MPFVHFLEDSAFDLLLARIHPAPAPARPVRKHRRRRSHPRSPSVAFSTHRNVKAQVNPTESTPWTSSRPSHRNSAHPPSLWPSCAPVLLPPAVSQRWSPPHILKSPHGRYDRCWPVYEGAEEQKEVRWDAVLLLALVLELVVSGRRAGGFASWRGGGGGGRGGGNDVVVWRNANTNSSVDRFFVAAGAD
ncbi:hypothetical protein GALMADRAFT_156173 [Galerina marginata CBS 339.88]|uniref:Uncharacterized protein n=1 Tax=Galerina marginata (strain CBS 339.88) TaxID=685588 RepID=A0A067TCW7_GALM3|nr:hypothetical protein GALMADRAFT_156173 [Galerina marginata CBS 339.88]